MLFSLSSQILSIPSSFWLCAGVLAEAAGSQAACECSSSGGSALFTPSVSCSFRFIDTHTIDPKERQQWEKESERGEQLRHNWHLHSGPVVSFFPTAEQHFPAHPHLICMIAFSSHAQPRWERTDNYNNIGWCWLWSWWGQRQPWLQWSLTLKQRRHIINCCLFFPCLIKKCF